MRKIKERAKATMFKWVDAIVSRLTQSATGPWEPMYTAPRGGEEIIVKFDDGTLRVCYWLPGIHGRKGAWVRAADGRAVRDKEAVAWTRERRPGALEVGTWGDKIVSDALCLVVDASLRVEESLETHGSSVIPSELEKPLQELWDAIANYEILMNK